MFLIQGTYLSGPIVIQMEINDDMITRLEILSRLRLSESERENIKNNLASVVEMFGKISEVDTEGIEPLLSMTGVHNVWREDKAGQSPDTEKILEGSPGVQGPYFYVPKVIE